MIKMFFRFESVLLFLSAILAFLFSSALAALLNAVSLHLLQGEIILLLLLPIIYGGATTLFRNIFSEFCDVNSLITKIWLFIIPSLGFFLLEWGLYYYSLASSASEPTSASGAFNLSFLNLLLMTFPLWVPFIWYLIQLLIHQARKSLQKVSNV